MNKKPINLTEKQASIWNEIKDAEVQYYALSDKRVSDICEPANIDPEELYLTLKGPAAIVSIEEVLNKTTVLSWSGKKVPKYIIEAKEKFAVVSDNPETKSPVKK